VYYQTPKPVYNLLYLANMRTEASNFLFLKQNDTQLVRLGALAERYFHDDANTCLIKLRQFGELLVQLIAAKTGLLQSGDESQADLLRRLRFERLLPSKVADLFHEIRILGNRATHGAGGTPGEALNALKYARQIGIRFHRTYGKEPKFVAGPFQSPAASQDAAAPIRAELERLRTELLASKSAAEQAQLIAEENALARQSADEKRACKERWMDRLIGDLDREFPGIAGAVVQREMSTAETMHQYLNTPSGAVYGFAPQGSPVEVFAFTPRTHIAGL
jgi:hypothetical protein